EPGVEGSAIGFGLGIKGPIQFVDETTFLEGLFGRLLRFGEAGISYEVISIGCHLPDDAAVPSCVETAAVAFMVEQPEGARPVIIGLDRGGADGELRIIGASHGDLVSDAALRGGARSVAFAWFRH